MLEPGYKSGPNFLAANSKEIELNVHLRSIRSLKKFGWCRLWQVEKLGLKFYFWEHSQPPKMTLTLTKIKVLRKLDIRAVTSAVWSFNLELGVMPIYQLAPFWQIIKMSPWSSRDATWWETASPFYLYDTNLDWLH